MNAMTPNRTARPSTALVATLLAAATSFIGAPAALAAASADAAEQHRQEVATCNRGASPEGRQTCLYEARAAWAQEKGSGLTIAGTDYAANASLRCQALSGSDRKACLARMQGDGTVSGSVAGGGVLRELATRTTVPAAGTPAPAPGLR
jgi:hypothetical protein